MQDAAKQKEAARRAKKREVKAVERKENTAAIAAREEGDNDFVGLQDSVQRAYTSFLQAYPTKEKIVRYIFSSQALNLGHVP